jgi:hypothetical protein
MPNFSRTELITTLAMMLHTVENNTDKEVNRTIALSMFEVTLSYYNLFTQGKGDKKFIQTCYNKAKEGGPIFVKYVHKFEELIKEPPLRRSTRLANKRI